MGLRNDPEFEYSGLDGCPLLGITMPLVARSACTDFSLCRVVPGSLCCREDLAGLLGHFVEGTGAEISANCILDIGFKQEVVKLAHVVGTPNLSAEQEREDSLLARYEQSLNELTTTKSGPFYKGLTLFATGMYICARAGDVHSRVRTDIGHGIKLKDITTQLAGLSVPSDTSALLSGDTIVLPDVDSWSSFQSGLGSILANASSRFKEQNAESIEQVEGKPRAFFQLVCDAGVRFVSDSFAAACEHLLKSMDCDAGSEASEGATVAVVEAAQGEHAPVSSYKFGAGGGLVLP